LKFKYKGGKMINIVHQDTLNIIMFISEDESAARVTELVLRLYEKGFVPMNKYDAAYLIESVAGHQSPDNLYCVFSRSVRKFKFQKFSFTRNVERYDGSLNLLRISNVTPRASEPYVDLTIKPSEQDRELIKEYISPTRCSRHVRKPLRNDPFIPIKVKINTGYKSFKSSTHTTVEEELRERIPEIIENVREFESNYLVVYPLVSQGDIFSNYCRPPNHHTISSNTFKKILKRADVIKEVSIPPKEIQNRFIDICELFKNSVKNDKIIVHNFSFVSTIDKGLKISLFDTLMCSEENFNPFRYFDHPGINFCADYAYKSNILDKLEMKISKEIITKI